MPASERRTAVIFINAREYFGYGAGLIDKIRTIRYDRIPIFGNVQARRRGRKESICGFSDFLEKDGKKEMRKAVLFIAMSLDGYIADVNGGVDWLNGQSNDSETADPYAAFAEGIDTVFMGWNTYRQIVTELSPETWIYGDFLTYVFTHRRNSADGEICFTDKNPAELLRELKQKEGKDIWICGGADLAGQLLCADLIDRYDISVIPTLLGKGIRLFGERECEKKLSLVKAQDYNGIVELIYERRCEGICDKRKNGSFLDKP